MGLSRPCHIISTSPDRFTGYLEMVQQLVHHGAKSLRGKWFLQKLWNLDLIPHCRKLGHRVRGHQARHIPIVFLNRLPCHNQRGGIAALGCTSAALSRSMFPMTAWLPLLTLTYCTVMRCWPFCRT